nr:hypothetical protein [uncultured Pseudogulbenkiania sp.]
MDDLELIRELDLLGSSIDDANNIIEEVDFEPPLPPPEPEPVKAPPRKAAPAVPGAVQVKATTSDRQAYEAVLMNVPDDMRGKLIEFCFSQGISPDDALLWSLVFLTGAAADMSSVARANIEEYRQSLLDADKSAFNQTKELIMTLKVFSEQEREKLDKSFALTLEQRTNEVTEQALESITKRYAHATASIMKKSIEGDIVVIRSAQEEISTKYNELSKKLENFQLALYGLAGGTLVMSLVTLFMLFKK